MNAKTRRRTWLWISVIFSFTLVAIVLLTGTQLYHVSSSKREKINFDAISAYKKAILRKQYKTLNKANRLFLKKNYTKSLKWYARLDSLSEQVPGKWKPLVEDFVEMLDTYEKQKDSLNTLILTEQNKNLQQTQNVQEKQKKILEYKARNATLEQQIVQQAERVYSMSKINDSLMRRAFSLEKDSQKISFENEDHKIVRYYGRVEKAKANGFGVGIFDSGGVYEGEWKNNISHGKGRYTWKNGDRYEGEYQKGKREGYGIYTYASGIRYEGYWKDNLRHGKGKIYSPENKLLLEGRWEENKFQKEKNKGKK